MELQGKIKLIGESKQVTEKFTKRDLILTTEEQYPQTLCVEFVQDKCGLLDKFKVGDDVKVGVNLRGREWVNTEGQTKYFNSIQGWRIDKTEVQQHNPLPTHAEQEDDLPF